MKRFFAVITAILILALFSACGGSEPEEEPTVPVTEAPTDAPYIDTQIDEPEWTLAEGVLTMEDKDKVYAQGSDFVCFAVVGAEPSQMEMMFRFDDATAAMLTQQSKTNKYYITLDGSKIGDATLSDDGYVATVAAKDATEDIPSLASRIRGLR